MKPTKLPTIGNLLFPSTVDDLFSRFWDDTENRKWTPSVDVEESPDAYVITAELPGIDVADVELTVTADTLTLKGEKKSPSKEAASEKAGEADKRHITERVYGAFSRSFTFPVPVATDDVAADAKNGVLTITLQKAEREKTRRIEIRGS